MTAWWLWHRLRGHRAYRYHRMDGDAGAACTTCDKDWGTP